jgi:hypothetical protein
MARGTQVKSDQIIIDELPAEPSVYDDEFNNSTLTGWTTLGTLDTLESTSWRGNVHMKRVQTSWNVDGIYKASPTSYPYTITIKISDCALHANYQHYGILLLESGVGKLISFGALHQSASSATIAAMYWNSYSGKLWITYYTNTSLAFSIAHIGIFGTCTDQSGTAESYFDYLRVS